MLSRRISQCHRRLLCSHRRLFYSTGSDSSVDVSRLNDLLSRRIGQFHHRLFCSTDSGDSNVDVSRLNDYHRQLANKRIPPVSYEWQKERKEIKSRFGLYGKRSGVDIARCWPSVQEIEDMNALGLSTLYSSAVAEVKTNEAREEHKVSKRLSELNKNIKSLPSRLEKFEASRLKEAVEKSEQDKKLERKIREIQEYFGYYMDPKDPRFESMFKQKEAEEKKAEKLAKRQEAQKKKIADAV